MNIFQDAFDGFSLQNYNKYKIDRKKHNKKTVLSFLWTDEVI